MRFSAHLATHITPEWRKQYISYDDLKNIIAEAIDTQPQTYLTPHLIDEHYKRYDEIFFQQNAVELVKINTFFSEKFAEAKRKFTDLNSDLEVFLHTVSYREGVRPTMSERAKLREFKFAFSEYYLSLVLLQNYQFLNGTGFRKIMKKHDKVLPNKIGEDWYISNVTVSPFFSNREIDEMIVKVQNIFTEKLEQGDRQKAMKRLRIPPFSKIQSAWTTFRLGVLLGAFIVLFIAVVISSIHFPGNSLTFQIGFKLFRGPLLLVQYLFLVGGNVYGWRTHGINHVLIFELDPRDYIAEQAVLEVAAFIGVVLSVCMLSFCFAPYINIPRFLTPIIFNIFLFAFMINPFNFARLSSRRWTMKIAVRLFSAPLFKVHFADFWLADQLISLNNFLLDLEYLCVFYFSNGYNFHEITENFNYGDINALRAFIYCMPSWIRLAQCCRRYYNSKCLPHLVNAGKYVCSLLSAVFDSLRKYHQATNSSSQNVYLYIWLTLAIINFVFAYTWDVKIDWGLFSKSGGENRFLREEIIYRTYVYYVAIVANFALRFVGIVTGLCHAYNKTGLLTSITAPLEVSRRIIWNFLRLENEHLNNVGMYRAVRDISIKPMEASTDAFIRKPSVLVRERAKSSLHHQETRRSLINEEFHEIREQSSEHGGSVLVSEEESDVFD